MELSLKIEDHEHNVGNLLSLSYNSRAKSIPSVVCEDG